MAQHNWGPSRVGHGEAQCLWCRCTNREAMVLGQECPSAPVPSEPVLTGDNKRISITEVQIEFLREKIALGVRALTEVDTALKSLQEIGKL